MKRILWWTFTVLAAISAVLAVLCIVVYAWWAYSNPAWLQVYATRPLHTLLPIAVYSVLPGVWLILRARHRRRHNLSRGFNVELVSPAQNLEVPPGNVS